MSLDSSSLKSDIENIFDSQPESTGEFASELASAIISYLGDVTISYPSAPGISPAPPYTDPSFVGTSMDPVVPPDSMLATLESGINASIAASNTDSATDSDWSSADSAYSSVLQSIGASWQSSDGYMATGGTVASKTVGFDSSWDVGVNGGSTSDVAQDLSDRIHSATTAAVFTGAYVKGAFVGPAPHVSNLS